MRGARATPPDPEDPDIVEELTRQEHSAVEKWLALQRDGTGSALPNLIDWRKTRDAIERLCGDDQHLSWLELELVAPMLDYIAQKLRIPGPPQGGSSVAITASRPRRRLPADRKPIDEAPFKETLRQMRPDLSEGEINAKWFEHQARCDRERARRAKGRRR